MSTSIPLALFISAGLALWLAILTQRRAHARGVRIFAWLMAAVALWCVTSALHALAPTLPLKLAWAKVQYVGIASVPVLWLMFAAEYGGAVRLTPYERRLLWVVPVVTMLLAATNERHDAVWSAVHVQPSGLTVYEHGWWFWVDATYNYALVLGGSRLLARSARRSAPVFRAQVVALVAAAAIPIVANIVYLSGVTVPGLDLTPLAFTASGFVFAWSLYRNRLFDLIPVAREMVVESLTDAMIVLDPSRRILDVNAAAVALAGGTSAVTGRQIDEVLPPLEGMPLVPTGSTPLVVVHGVNGQNCRFDVRVMPVQLVRGDAAWVVLMRDVTDQWRAANERDMLQARMQEQQRREGLSVLVAGLAHDFNNLLAGIVGNADLLSIKVPPNSDMARNVSAILLGAQRAADLVSKMLAYAGERHGSLAHIDLDALTRELLELLRAAAARHCTIEYYGTSACIEGDATQIRQVAMNLIINAAESVDEGSGMVTVTTGIGRLTAGQLAEMTFGQDAEAGEYAFLEVRDNGQGMDPQTLRRIFIPFFTTKPSGHGLGLAAVQGIVLGHRGALRVDSETGRGSRFCVWFPLAGSTRGEVPGRPRVRQAG